MTVRWKPLIVLSGLFLVIAVMGVLAITYALVPARPQDVLPLARQETAKLRFDRALVQYGRALQPDPKNAAIHLEKAGMLATWLEHSPAEFDRIHPMWLSALADVVKYAKQDPSKRDLLTGALRQLLSDALRQEDLGTAIDRAQQLLPLDPDNPDVHFALAEQAIDRLPPNVSEAQTHLQSLSTRAATSLRTAWVRAQIAREAADTATLNELLALSRGMALDSIKDPVDRMCLLRLRQLAVLQSSDPVALVPLVESFREDARSLAPGPRPAPARFRLISQMLERVQAHLAAVAVRTAAPADKERVTKLAESLETLAEKNYQEALAAGGTADPRPYVAYISHLLFRKELSRCLDEANKALGLPFALMPTWQAEVAQLQELAVKAALADEKDAARFDKAAPHIEKLLASSNTRFSAIGHLFQGVIDMEKSGIAEPALFSPTAAGTSAGPDPKLRASALGHLKTAATGLTDVPTAQALYGIALILARESGLGRQYLQKAMDGEHLEARYQVWAAWSILQAGYPEDAEPIVLHLLAQVDKGEQPREMIGKLHLLRGEIHQSRRTPDESRKARAEYQAALEAGEAVTPALELKLAQIDLVLGDRERGFERIQRLRSQGKGGAATEELAVLTLRGQGKSAEATQTLAAARAKFSDSDELVALDAALALDADHPDQADKILSEFLTRNPTHLEIVHLRARILGNELKKPDEARNLLAAIVDRAENSGPLVQLAMLELRQRNFDAAAQAIAHLRARWPESASADLLDAQLDVARENMQAAATHLDAALKKDPRNKVALFWKAQLDDRNGAGPEAERIYESILKDRPIKEIESGLSLAAAAQWALAAKALENQNIDEAIGRFEGLLETGQAGELARPVRWKLASAHAAKGQVNAARAEIAQLLNDPATTLDDRVQAADFYRRHDDINAANQQLAIVLKADPTHTGAIAYRALILSGQNQNTEAAAVIRKALSGKRQPPSLYLMLAALENAATPTAEGLAHAVAAIDLGLAVHPDSVDLVRARYKVLSLKKDPNAVAFVEEKARSSGQPAFRRLLVEVFRDETEFAKAERLAAELLNETPDDAALAATHVNMVAAQAIQAADRADRETERAANKRTADLIQRYRARFPGDLSFLQAECELAARKGDLALAKRITQEISALDKTSPVGPLLMARLCASEGRTAEMARAYEEALGRSPRRGDIRLALAQANLQLGKADLALEQAKFVLDADHEQPAAILLQAQALAAQEGTPAQLAAHQEEAIRTLEQAIAKRPQFADGYHLIAEIQLRQGNRDRAIATLRNALTALPQDDATIAMLIQFLSEAPAPGQAPTPANLREAMALAQRTGANDSQGRFCLAIAIGFHKAGQTDLALPWAEQAATKLDRPIVHLTCGDLLLAKAEAMSEQSSARDLFQRAVAEYDLVLKTQANSIEAVNNKAWILHRYLGQNAAALELAKSLRDRTDPAILPAEFFDTLGSIQEAMSMTREAEESYNTGISKAPDHPMLNYHMGLLLSTERDRHAQAVRYLKNAEAHREQLPPAIAAEVATLLKKLSR